LFERFTERARQVVVLAQDEARALKHNYIGTEHISSASCGRKRGSQPGFSRASTSPSRRCAPRSRASSARATR
jgi:ATP-dependent Clp protease ATP-binding subunit ClpA